MNNVVIRILDNTNSVLGDLDLKEFTDFPLVLTKGIVSLDNLKARTGTFTKVFKVPNTKNNANLLNNIDNINTRKDYKDALNRKPCVILIDGKEIERGFLQVSKVFEGFELDSYELVFFGNNVDWVKQAAELKLNDITFRNNAQIYNSASIDVANGSDSDTFDHCYPYISRGGNTSPNNTIVDDYTPVYYLRSLLERGFKAIGWNIESSFLLDADVKRLVCDFSLKFLVDEDEIAATRTRSQKVDSTVLSIGDSFRVNYTDDSTPPNEDTNSNFDTSTFEYVAPESASYDINLGLFVLNSGAAATNADYRLDIVKNGDSTTSIGSGTVLKTENVGFISSEYINADFENILLNAGDRLSVYVTNDSRDFVDITVSNVAAGIGSSDVSYLKVQRRGKLLEGDTFTLNSVLPSKVTFLEVVNDFTRLFNVYYWSDIKSKTVYFEPRNTFFKPITSALDWSDKLDLNNKYEIDYVSSYKRNIKFSYADLDADEWLKGWEKTNKRVYGEYTHNLPDRFAEGTTEVKLSLLSAGYAVKAKEATPALSGTLDEAKVFTTVRIWGEDVDSMPTERVKDYNPKIYLFNNGSQSSVGGTSREISMFGSTRTTIPYGIFETYNNTTSDINLSFSGVDGLFSTYYSNMLKNIEEGGRLIAYFNINNVDIDNLDFRNLVYISYPEKVKGYYLIESVIDYNPLKNSLTKVSLFKFEDLGSVPIDTSIGGIGDVDTDTGSTTPTIEPIYVEDGGVLYEVWSENASTGLIEPIYKD